MSRFLFFLFWPTFFHRFAQQISFAIILICVCTLCLSNPILFINVVFLSLLLPYFYSCKQKTVNLKCFRFAEKKIWRILFRHKTQISFHRFWGVHIPCGTTEDFTYWFDRKNVFKVKLLELLWQKICFHENFILSEICFNQLF